MSGFLLDTNVLSEFNRRGDPNPKVRVWLETVEVTSLYASVLTFAEIRFGVELLPPGRRRTELEEWIDRQKPRGSGIAFYRLTEALQNGGLFFAPTHN